MSIINLLEQARARHTATINAYVALQSVQSELNGLARYWPDHRKYMGVSYTPAQIKSHWQSRIEAPQGFDFTIPNIWEYLQHKKNNVCLELGKLRSQEQSLVGYSR